MELAVYLLCAWWLAFLSYQFHLTKKKNRRMLKQLEDAKKELDECQRLIGKTLFK